MSRRTCSRAGIPRSTTRSPSTAIAGIRPSSRTRTSCSFRSTRCSCAWLARSIGGHLLAAGLAVSLAAFGGAIVLMYRLAALEMDDRSALRAVALLSTFPFALFFSVDYTESLFLLETVGAFYAVRRGHLVRRSTLWHRRGVHPPERFLAGRAAVVDGVCTASRQAVRPRAPQPPRFLASCTPILGTPSSARICTPTSTMPWPGCMGRPRGACHCSGDRRAPDPPPPPWRARDQDHGGRHLYLGYRCVRPGRYWLFARWRADSASRMRSGSSPISSLLLVAHLFLSLGRFTSVLFPMFFWLAGRVPPSRLAPIAGGLAAAQMVLAVWFFLWHPVV